MSKQSMFVLVKEAYSSDTTLLSYQIVAMSLKASDMVKEAHKQLDYYFKGFEIKAGDQMGRDIYWCDVPGRDIKLMYAIHKVNDDCVSLTPA